jgi:hypothetical protein
MGEGEGGTHSSVCQPELETPNAHVNRAAPPAAWLGGPAAPPAEHPSVCQPINGVHPVVKRSRFVSPFLQTQQPRPQAVLPPSN